MNEKRKLTETEEEAVDALERASTLLRQTKAQTRQLEIDMDSLGASFAKRKRVFKDIRLSISRQVQMAFAAHMDAKRFYASLEFDHK